MLDDFGGHRINSQQKRFHQQAESTDLEHCDEDCECYHEPPKAAVLIIDLILDLICEPAFHRCFVYRQARFSLARERRGPHRLPDADPPPARGPVFVACPHRRFQYRRGLIARRTSRRRSRKHAPIAARSPRRSLTSLPTTHRNSLSLRAGRPRRNISAAICKADMDLLLSPLENFRAAQPNLIFSLGCIEESCPRCFF